MLGLQRTAFGLLSSGSRAIRRAFPPRPTISDTAQHTLSERSTSMSTFEDIADDPSAIDAVPNPHLLPSRTQVVLILVGLIASGKSTFAQALEQHYPEYRRCNQDDLDGKRQHVENLVRKSLRAGMSVCIDRTNFNVSQRATWINIAHEFPGTPVWVLVFDIPPDLCAERLASRTGHPTITSTEQGLNVLDHLRSQFRRPASYEGYSRILNLKPSDLPSNAQYSGADIQNIMQRLQDMPEMMPSHLDRGDSRRGNPRHHFQRGGFQYRGAPSSRRAGGASDRYGHTGWRDASYSESANRGRGGSGGLSLSDRLGDWRNASRGTTYTPPGRSDLGEGSR